MNRREVTQRLMDKIMVAVAEALDANAGVSSKEAAGVIFGCGIGALKAEGVSKKDILIEAGHCFDGAIDHGKLQKGGSA
jgi:hypothetical protein